MRTAGATDKTRNTPII